MHLPDLFLSKPLSLSEQLERRPTSFGPGWSGPTTTPNLLRLPLSSPNFVMRPLAVLTKWMMKLFPSHFGKQSISQTMTRTHHSLQGFFEKPCKASAIVDLFAPGFPDYLLDSSSTSGGLPKTFPSYNRLSKIRSSDADSCVISNTLRRRTTAFVLYLGCD